MNPVLKAACLLALGLLAGCASYSGGNLVPGASTEAEVLASMGNPADRLVTPEGENVWFYPRAPYGRQTYAVIIGPDHVVRRVEARLTPENVKKLVVGKTTMADLRALMGPPERVLRYPFHDGDSWEYRMIPGPKIDWMYLSVRFDPAGVASVVTYIDDPEKNEAAPGRMLFWNRR